MSTMFRGQFEHAIDAKGRTSLPARYRDVLAATNDLRLVVTPALFDPCLKVYPMKAWEELEAKIAALPEFDPNAILLRRRFLSAAVECDLAKNDPARKGYNLDCDPLPVLAENLHLTADGGLPDGGKPDLSHTAGAAINRAFATEDKPLTCQIYPASDPEVNLGGYCRPQLTADEISKL